MIEQFQATMRPLVAKIRKNTEKNRMGETIFTESVKNFDGVIFSASPRDFTLQNDIDGVKISHTMYATEKFAKKDIIVDGTKKYEVVASLEVRDWKTNIDHYKTFLLELV